MVSPAQSTVRLGDGVVEGPAGNRSHAAETGKDVRGAEVGRRVPLQCSRERLAEALEAIGIQLAQVYLIPVHRHLRGTLQHTVSMALNVPNLFARTSCMAAGPQ